MRGLVKYFIKYSISGNVLLALILIFGILGLLNMQSAFFPETPNRNISVQVVYPGASPQEIEQSVVLKIEDNLTGITGVERITSISNENAGTVSIEIKQNADIKDVLEDVKNAVDQITSFPVGLESVDVFKVEQLGRALSFAIHGDMDLFEIKKEARKIERDLLAFDGISKVTLNGFPEEEIVIAFDENKLTAYNLTFQAVMDKVAATNIELTGGEVKGDFEQFRIRSDNKVYSGKELESIVILGTEDGRVVRLKDVATITDGWSENPNRAFYNGKRAVIIDLNTTNDEDILVVSDFVKEYIENFNERNDVLQANVTIDFSKTIEQRIDMLVDNGMIGVTLVFLLLAFFLHFRLAFWVAFSIPIAFGGMFILANFFGITLNVISLFGMITVIGILVDDGVVVSENIYQHYESGKSRVQAAVDGTMEVLPAIFSAILTTMIAFSAFFFIDGRLGDFFSEMAFIVIATLLFSLVEGIFILPAHVAHSKALDKDAGNSKFLKFTNNVMNFLRHTLYEPVLDKAIKHPFLAFAIPVGILMITFGSMGGGIIKAAFFPNIEGENINVNIQTPAGTPEDITLDILDYVEKSIWEINQTLVPEGDTSDVFLSVDKRLGPNVSNKGSLTVSLMNNELREDRDLTYDFLVGKIRDKIGIVAGVESLTFGTGNPFGLPVSIAFRGDDMDDLRRVVERVKTELYQLSDLKDITDSDFEGNREIHIKLKDKAYLLGLTERTIMSQVRQGFFGGEIQRLQRGTDEIKVWVRYDEDERSSINNLENMSIRTIKGENFPLKELADFEIKKGVIGISHTNSKREIKVEADIANDEITAPVMLANIETNIVPQILADFEGITADFEGQNREQMKSMKSMQTVMPIILLLMLAVVILTFRSFSQTAAVFLLIPFAFIGVGWGHFIHDMPMSLFSFLGVIALIGIVINDSLVFVNAFNTNIKNGISYNESLKKAALSRFRPIVLTSITTIAGLAPLMLETSFQAQFLIPMAVAIAYGLAVGTVVILFVLPVLLIATNKFKRFIHWWWYGVKLSKEEVEPAYKELKYEDA